MFSIQHLADIVLLALKRIGTNDNESDIMTKNVGKTILHTHILSNGKDNTRICN